MNNLYLTNSLTKQKEVFKPINPEKISLYACGPTVYDKPHVGNARALVIFDLLFRILKEIYGKTKVTYVRNITDIDDKIIEASKKKGISISELTKEVTREFHLNCISLFCMKPTLEPKATDHIDEMISMTNNLIKLKAAYEKKGHVYFSVSSFKGYGKMVILDLGNSYHLIFSGLSEILCKRGEWIEKGGILGDMGINLNNNDLYMEVRFKGKTISPKNWASS